MEQEVSGNGATSSEDLSRIPLPSLELLRGELPCPEADAAKAFPDLVSLYNDALNHARHDPVITSFAGMSGTIAVYGGSFDPVHLDHIRVALGTREHLGADAQIVFLPNKANPDKPGGPRTLAGQRFDMLREGLAYFDGLFVSDLEMNSAREKPMTYDTMEIIRQQVAAGTELRLVLGSDILNRPHYFHGIHARHSVFTPIFVERNTFPRERLAGLAGVLAQEDLECITRNFISVGDLPLSSTMLRELCEHGKLEKELLPPGVFEYLMANGLYRPPAGPNLGEGVVH